MADSLGTAFVNVITLEAVASEADFTLALAPTRDVSTQGIGMATPIVFLALVDILTVGAISKISSKADTAVAAQGVVAAGLWVTAVQATETFIDVVAQQTIALVAHAANTGEDVSNFQTLSLRVALAACRLAVTLAGN